MTTSSTGADEPEKKETRAQFLRRTDPDFELMLEKSKVYVGIVARWLRAHGHDVRVPETVARPTEEERGAYRDRGDLFIRDIRYEVKGRGDGYNFHTREDFPFDTLIVDDCQCLDGLDEQPKGHYILSEDGSACFYVDRATRPHWTRVQKKDTQKGRMREFYEVPIGLAAFHKIPERFWVGAFAHGDMMLAANMVYERVPIDRLYEWKEEHGLEPTGSIPGVWPPCILYESTERPKELGEADRGDAMPW